VIPSFYGLPGLLIALMAFIIVLRVTSHGASLNSAGVLSKSIFGQVTPVNAAIIVGEDTRVYLLSPENG
jgi:hypothetical protein